MYDGHAGVFMEGTGVEVEASVKEEMDKVRRSRLSSKLAMNQASYLCSVSRVEFKECFTALRNSLCLNLECSQVLKLGHPAVMPEQLYLLLLSILSCLVLSCLTLFLAPLIL